MGETSDNDDDLRSELNVMMMMSELDLWSRCAWGVRRRLLLSWKDVHAALVTAPTPTHGPARTSAG